MFIILDSIIFQKLAELVLVGKGFVDLLLAGDVVFFDLVMRSADGDGGIGFLPIEIRAPFANELRTARLNAIDDEIRRPVAGVDIENVNVFVVAADRQRR